ncbi:N-acetylmuramoyl-L-alanine amidase [Streptomyces sp. A0958]|uniref:peptidoglycan-binding protein n=1 Tax=Streptomyces sp. A0958 TaxID=2563101 RepID=UPI00109E7DEE|nr:peptidoglycan-binding protein [Streptomyces sp. A0958]THA62117.1 N-acetylmuramoyl-L-alanine amidase [Streptomyces sp. A0958]
MPTRAAHPKARASLLAALTATVLAATGTPALAATDTGHPMDRAFERAAEEFDVPRDLLAAVGYGETRLDGHAGRPSQANGFGVMHLVSNPAHHTLERAAALTGEPLAALRSDNGANILGGAAVLRGYADTLGLDARDRDDLDAWYPAVVRYSGTDGPAAALYADTVYTFLADGLDAVTRDGERITVTGRPVSPHKDGIAATDTGTRSADYPAALWVAADPNNYTTGRTAAIDRVIIHVTQGSYAGSISWFQDPVSEVSAHYVVRSSDGQITQMVRDADTAYHARSANASTLGIEHEGFIDDPSWFTDAMYRSSAALTAYLCDKYGIPKDRTHIIGHSEAPGNDHTDPGPNWDWNRYMELVKGTGTGGESRDGLSFGTYTTQRGGSAGPQVKALQLLLNDLDYPVGEADGGFGPVTTGAVTSFQAAHGLEADGVVGARTWTALLSAGSAPALAEGATGEDVKRLQRALTAALGSTVEADGSFGPATATAVRSYQTSRDLTADGVVGTATWAALQAGR